jgi:hypothetical protein
MKYFTFLFLLLPSLLLAQKESIDFAAGQKSSLVFLTKSQKESQYRLKTKNLFSPTVGIFYNQKIKERKWLRLGLRYATTSYQIKPTIVLSYEEIVNGGSTNLPWRDIIGNTYTYRHIDFVVAYRHFLTTQKLSFFIEPQVSNGFLRSIVTNTTSTVANGYAANIGLGVGAEYPLTNRLKFVTQFNSNVAMFYLPLKNSQNKTFTFYNTNGIDIGLRYFY